MSGRGRGGKECEREKLGWKGLCLLLRDGEGTGLSEASGAFVSGHTLVGVSQSPAFSQKTL